MLLRLFERFPPTDLIFKDPGPRAPSEYEDEVARPFSRWFGMAPADLLFDKDVLDLGCGYGGRPVRFVEHGARGAGVEIAESVVASGLRYARGRGIDLDLRVGTGESIPFPAASFDLVTMYDVMEHVFKPREVVVECFRVLRPGGHLAVVFPPYYSVTAGSHLHGYATSVPGLNLVFRTSALKSATQKHLDRSGWKWRDFLRDVPTDKLWNLNGLTIRAFRQIVAESGFRPRLVRYMGQRDRRLSSKHGVRMLPLTPAFLMFQGLASLPVVREAFCTRVVALLERP